MKQVKFGVFTDLHVDIMHDTQARLQVFLDTCRAENVDFIIQLGDFCYPDDNRKVVCDLQQLPTNIINALTYPTYADKNALIRMFNDFEKPSYHVLGNHDCDMCTKEETLGFLEMQSNSYYSFDCGGFHFIVLDTNYLKTKSGAFWPYENCNYAAAAYDPSLKREWVSNEQILWLKDDLSKTNFPSIVFSHATLSKTIAPICSIKNCEEIQAVLSASPSGVIACFNGHQHVDICEQESGIWYIIINAMGNLWLGSDYTCENRYGPDIDAKFPNVKYTAPYKDAVFAIVTIDENGISIQGRPSQFVGPAPEALGLYEPNSWWTRAYGYRKRFATPSQTDRYLPIQICTDPGTRI